MAAKKKAFVPFGKAKEGKKDEKMCKKCKKASSKCKC